MNFIAHTTRNVGGVSLRLRQVYRFLGWLSVLLCLVLPGIVHPQESAEVFPISFDVYFDNNFLGDVVGQVNIQGELLALNTTPLLEKLPPLLEQLGLREHPFLASPPEPGLLDVKGWRNRGIILEPDIGTFQVQLVLPPLYRPVQDLSLSTQEDVASTVSPARYRGWLAFSGSLSKNADNPLLHRGFWRGGLARGNWYLFADGDYGDDTEQPLALWRLERSRWGVKRNFQQLGWLNVPLLVEGQTTDGAVRGLAIGSAYNWNLTTNILEELPGGIIELEEDSELEIFVDGVLERRFNLEAGRYRVRDLVLTDGIHTVDLRITTRSGRVIEQRIQVDSFFSVLPAGEYEYLLLAGERPNEEDDEGVAGLSFNVGVGWGLALGLQGTHFVDQGERYGFLAEKILRKGNLGLSAWWQNIVDEPQRSEFNARLGLGGTLLGFGATGRWRDFGPGAEEDSLEREVNLSFAPRWKRLYLGTFNVGWERQINQVEGYYYRFSRSWILTAGLTLGLSFSHNERTEDSSVSLSIGLRPRRSSSINAGSSWTRETTNRRLAFNQQFLDGRANVGLDLNESTERSGRAVAEWRQGLFELRGESRWREDEGGQLLNEDNSLNYSTALLFADGSWALAPKSEGTFLVVDASQLDNPNRIEVEMTGERLPGLFGHWGMGKVVPYNANRLTIDPSEIGFGFDVRNEIINPSPGQAFRLRIKPKEEVSVLGRLLLPDGEPLALAYGKIEHQEEGTQVEWFTGSDGDFFFEGEPGIWEDQLFWEGEQYLLRVEVDRDKVQDGVLLLGDITLEPL